MILLDTTVLVYAAGQDHPLREPCRRLLEAHASGAVRCTTTVEVVQEFTHVYARRRTKSDAAEVARQYLVAFDLLSTTAEDLALGLRLFVAHPALGAFDSVVAAVALNRDLAGLVSADRAFADVSRLRWLDPAGAVTPPS